MAHLSEKLNNLVYLQYKQTITFKLINYEKFNIRNIK